MISAGFLLLAVSVLKELFFRPVGTPHGSVLSANNPDPEILMRCHDSIASLSEDLGTISTELLALPRTQSPEEARIMPRWEEFSQQWLMRWDDVNARCRFSELRNDSMGEAYHLMAEVHGDLPAMRLKYKSLLAHFAHNQTTDLARMQRQLARAKQLLRYQRNPKSEEAP